MRCLRLSSGISGLGVKAFTPLLQCFSLIHPPVSPLHTVFGLFESGRQGGYCVVLLLVPDGGFFRPPLTLLLPVGAKCNFTPTGMSDIAKVKCSFRSLTLPVASMAFSSSLLGAGAKWVMSSSSHRLSTCATRHASISKNSPRQCFQAIIPRPTPRPARCPALSAAAWGDAPLPRPPRWRWRPAAAR